MNSIKTYLAGLGRAARAVILALGVVFISAGIAQAATTISTSILTNGTLGVTGISTFGATASTTISASGVLTTPAGAVALFLGGASTTQFTLLSGDTIKNASASSTVITGTLTVATSTTVDLNATGMSVLASTTATSFKVGQVGTQLSQVVAGYCVATVTFTALNTASSTQTTANCTPYTNVAGVPTAITSLTAVTSRVIAMATSSLPFYIVLQAASSTSSTNIQVALTNISTTTIPAASSIYAFNFIAFQ